MPRRSSPREPSPHTVGIGFVRPTEESLITSAAERLRVGLEESGKVIAGGPLIVRGHQYDSVSMYPPLMGMVHLEEVWITYMVWDRDKAPRPRIDEREGHRG